MEPRQLLDIRFGKFLLVGVANTAFGLCVIYACKWGLGFDDVQANFAGYAVGLGLSFVLNKQWTFGFSGRTLPALTRFLVVFLAAYAANLTTVLVCIRVAGIDGDWAQLIGIVPYTLLFYLGSRCYALRVEPRVGA
jgi:putative flippase GtrA